MECARMKKVSELGEDVYAHQCHYSTVSGPIWLRLGTLMCLNTLYILLIFHANISNSFKVIELFVIPL